MAEHDLDELMAELQQVERRLQSIHAKLGAARNTTLPAIGRTDDGALIVAGYLETYYTALETFFVRVSRFFENRLRPQRWHASLLEKMCLAIPDLREPVVSEGNLGRLRELLRFRHFRRYYVEMEYDWTRIDFLIATIDAAHPVVLRDLALFGQFLHRLDAEAGE